MMVCLSHIPYDDMRVTCDGVRGAYDVCWYACGV